MLAIRAAEVGARVVVLDRRDEGVARPQLLVARPGDLARLASLGLDIGDADLVAPIAVRSGRDRITDRRGDAEVDPRLVEEPEASTIYDLAFERPVALIAIERLQAALAAEARARGVEFRYNAEVSRVRRHARCSSVDAGEGSVRGRLVCLATGAAGHLVPPALARAERSGPASKLIAGVIDRRVDRGRWMRTELDTAGGRLRCVLLGSITAGVALLVEAPDVHHPSVRQLERCFRIARRHHGLDGARYAIRPQVFETGARALVRRVIAGDNRAPMLIAGDAAQSGHVFSGLTCFVNVAIADRLGGLLTPALEALAEGRVNDPRIAELGAAYETLARVGARELEVASRRSDRTAGGWALGGVA